MTEAGIGRLLVASLHQAIADLLPTRLEFYESWLNPRGMRDGRIGRAPLTAVLSFLRKEGEAYGLVAARAGEYTADWTVEGLSGMRRALMARTPRGLRPWLVMRVAREMVRATSTGSDAIVSWRRGAGAVELQGSIFCDVRDRAPSPLCAFFSAAVRRLFARFGLDAEVEIGACRATGTSPCLLNVTMRTVRIATDV